MRRFFMAIVIAVIAIFGYYFKSQHNPITGEKQRISISMEQEIALGKESAPEFMQQFGGISTNMLLRERVNTVSHRIVEKSVAKTTTYPYQFHVLADEKVVNAFALPGGQIFITEALLKLLPSDHHLAAIMSHEIGHVIARHGAERLSKEKLTQGLVEATVVATADESNPQGNAILAQLVGGFINMKYGREDELESDDLGVRLMIESGYNPQAMIEVMDILNNANGATPPEFLSTHPASENRKKTIQEAIVKYKK